MTWYEGLVYAVWSEVRMVLMFIGAISVGRWLHWALNYGRKDDR